VLDKKSKACCVTQKILTESRDFNTYYRLHKNYLGDLTNLFAQNTLELIWQKLYYRWDVLRATFEVLKKEPGFWFFVFTFQIQ
jgi:hypothetical protein